MGGGDVPRQIWCVVCNVCIAIKSDFYCALDVSEGHQLNTTVGRRHVPVPGRMDSHIRPGRWVNNPDGCNAHTQVKGFEHRPFRSNTVTKSVQLFIRVSRASEGMRHDLNEWAVPVMRVETDSADQLSSFGSDVPMGVVSICDTGQTDVVCEQLGESRIVDVSDLTDEPIVNQGTALRAKQLLGQ